MLHLRYRPIAGSEIYALAPGPVSVKLGQKLVKAMNQPPSVYAAIIDFVDFGEFHQNRRAEYD